MEEFFKNKALCIESGCEMADVCLRAIGYKKVTGEDRQFVIINPNLVTGKSDCPYRATVIMVTYAKGFRLILNKLSKETFDYVYSELSSHFGKNPYYERRNGKRLITPEEQVYITFIFSRYGVNSDIFDEYIVKEEWKE